MREELPTLADTVEGQKAILNKAIIGGWKNLRQVSNKKQTTKQEVKKMGYIERDYNMDSLELRILQSQDRVEEK